MPLTVRLVIARAVPFLLSLIAAKFPVQGRLDGRNHGRSVRECLPFKFFAVFKKPNQALRCVIALPLEFRDLIDVVVEPAQRLGPALLSADEVGSPPFVAACEGPPEYAMPSFDVV